MVYDQKGKLVYGNLATDRPHTFKLFSSYDKKWMGGTTHFAPVFNWYSGTPITTELGVNGVPLYPNGRGDLGRTPRFFQTDFLLTHDVRVKGSEQMFFRFEANISNLFNNSSVTNIDPGFDHPNDGGIQFENTADIFKGYTNYRSLMKAQDVRLSPSYGMASAYQNPRNIRLGFHFFF